MNSAKTFAGATLFMAGVGLASLVGLSANEATIIETVGNYA